MLSDWLQLAQERSAQLAAAHRLVARRHGERLAAHAFTRWAGFTADCIATREAWPVLCRCARRGAPGQGSLMPAAGFCYTGGLLMRIYQNTKGVLCSSGIHTRSQYSHSSPLSLSLPRSTMQGVLLLAGHDKECGKRSRLRCVDGAGQRFCKGNCGVYWWWWQGGGSFRESEGTAPTTHHRGTAAGRTTDALGNRRQGGCCWVRWKGQSGWA